MPKKKNNIEHLDTTADIAKWLSSNNIADVEVLVSDFAGISRGKLMPSGKFIEGIKTRGHRVPNSLFGLTIHCDFSHNEFITEQEEDYFLVPVMDTIRIVPWHDTPTACVICDVTKEDGSLAGVAPRQVLQRIVSFYHEKGWAPVVAPEFEFFLLAKQEQIESAPVPPRGRSGKVAWDTGELSIDGLEEFKHIFTDINQYCSTMQVQVDTLTHEAGPAQFEFNITHGDPIDVADQSFLFKRIIKQTAIRHDVFASFMAKPYPDQYGSAMHMHQSVTCIETGKNIFSDDAGNNSELFLSYIAGLQKYIPALMPFFAPYANSYLRICDRIDAPVNTHWGWENRSVGLRVPTSNKDARRVENRIAGADVNPYLVTAATLLAGYLGMTEKLEPSEPLDASAYDLDTHRLPQHLFSSLDNLEKSNVLREYLGEDFVTTYIDVKRQEYSANTNSLSPWEIRYLLLNV
jgi:glutamine synthetase